MSAISIWLNAEEETAIKLSAKKEGVSVSKLIKDRVFNPTAKDTDINAIISVLNNMVIVGKKTNTAAYEILKAVSPQNANEIISKIKAHYEEGN